MNEYTIGDTAVPLTFELIDNNVFVGGREVYARVINTSTSTELLTETLLTETTDTGIYRYLWDSSSVVTTKTECTIIYRFEYKPNNYAYITEHILFVSGESTLSLDSINDITEALSPETEAI